MIFSRSIQRVKYFNNESEIVKTDLVLLPNYVVSYCVQSICRKVERKVIRLKNLHKEMKQKRISWLTRNSTPIKSMLKTAFYQKFLLIERKILHRFNCKKVSKIKVIQNIALQWLSFFIACPFLFLLFFNRYWVVQKNEVLFGLNALIDNNILLIYRTVIRAIRSRGMIY